MAAIGVAVLVMFAERADAASVVLCLLLVFYGLRLGIYLAIRKKKSAAYNKVMKAQINDGSGLSVLVRALIWVVCALLYACKASPVLWRLANGCGTDACAVVGVVLMVAGIVLESAADLQKSAQKRVDLSCARTRTTAPTPNTRPMLSRRRSSCRSCRSAAWRTSPGSRARAKPSRESLPARPYDRLYARGRQRRAIKVRLCGKKTRLGAYPEVSQVSIIAFSQLGST